MNTKTIMLETAAIIFSYFILALPVSAATNVNIIFGGNSKQAILNQENAVTKDISSASGSGNVTVSIGGSVEKAYLYKCRDKDPANCDISAMDLFSGPFSKTYRFADIAANNIANLLILAKTAGTWLGFWEPLKIFGGHIYSSSSYPEGITLFSKTPNLDFIYDFITKYQALPFNTTSTSEKAEFSGANKLYVLKAKKEVLEAGAFEKIVVDSNSISGIDKDYYLVLANTSTGIKHPVTLFINPSFHCGFGPGYDYEGERCETGLGETQDNCCYDCACGQNFYCDAGLGCKKDDQISISVPAGQNTTVVNCRIENRLNITAKIINKPSTASIISARYTLNGTEYPISASTIIPAPMDTYIFPITIPPQPNCAGETYRVGPNTLSATITYMDGNKGEKTKTLGPASFPDVTVRSWTCGNRIAETELGETYANCCYDIPCPTNQYCDYIVPAEGRCRVDLTGNDLRVISLNPAKLYSHRTAGDTATANLNLINKPKSLSFTPSGCSINCLEGISFDKDCSSTCSIDSCSSLSSADQNIANISCTLRFSIQNYSVANPYRLTPTVSLSVNYNNGSSEKISKTISSSGPSLFIGMNYCGDGVCDSPHETSSTCCYDCGCPSGQYCDTNDTSRFTQGDACKALNNIKLSVQSASPTSFTDSKKWHTSTVLANAENLPSGSFIRESCEFPGGIACSAACGLKEQTGQVWKYNCNITIPPMDYNTTPLFDNSSKTIKLPGNLTFKIIFNNGSRRQSIERKTAMPQFTVKPVAECGDDVCDSRLDESASNCCIDCSCKSDSKFGSDYYCYTGSKTEGECKKTDQITLELKKPPVQTCKINLKGKCLFTGALDVEGEISNPPPNVSIVSATRELAGKKSDTNCIITENLNTSLKTNCSIVPDDIDSKNEGDESKTLKIHMTLSYMQGSAKYTTNTSDSTTLEMRREKSDEVRNCEAARQKVERQKDKVDSQKKLLDWMIGVWVVVAIVAWVCCEYKVWCCKLAKVLMVVIGCATPFWAHGFSKLDQRLDKLEDDRDAMCSADSMDGLSSSIRGQSSFGGMTSREMISWVICLISLYAGASIFSGDKAATAQPAQPISINIQVQQAAPASGAVTGGGGAGGGASGGAGGWTSAPSLA